MKLLETGSSESKQSTDQLALGLARLGIYMRSQAWERAGASRLTPTQGQILVVLQRAGRALRLTDVGAALSITAATASNAVGALLRKGLITKVVDPEDKRALRLTLTDDGHRAASEAAGWPDALTQALGTLTADERGVFQRSVVKLLLCLLEKGEVQRQRMCVTCQHFRPQGGAAPGIDFCNLVQTDIRALDLRVDCPEHVALSVHSADERRLQFLAVGAPPLRKNP